jgi:hypothetical protein
MLEPKRGHRVETINKSLLVPLHLDDILYSYYQYSLQETLMNEAEHATLLGESSGLYFFLCEVPTTDEFGQPCTVWYLLVGTKAGTLRQAFLVNIKQLYNVFGSKVNVGAVLDAIISSAHLLIENGLSDEYNFLGTN